MKRLGLFAVAAIVGCSGTTEHEDLGVDAAVRDGGAEVVRDGGAEVVRDGGDEVVRDGGTETVRDAGARDGGSPGLYFPPTVGDTWATVEPSSVGWDSSAIDEALDYAMGERSTAVIILLDGRILAERYAATWDLHTARAVFSVTKSVTAFLVGLLEQDGALELDDTVTSHLGAGWSAAAPADEGVITIRHLLTMTSGLDEGLARVAAPGDVWFYNTPAYHVLFDVIAAASGQSRDDFASTRLHEPIGLMDSTWLPQRLSMSARDMARFGLMILAEGAWDGTPLVTDPTILDAALRPSQSLNPAYGHLWWLNGQDGFLLPGDPAPGGAGPLMPDAPADLVAALGAGDKKIYVARSMGLVVVRHGSSAGEPAAASSSFDNLLWQAILRAAP